MKRIEGWLSGARNVRRAGCLSALVWMLLMVAGPARAQGTDVGLVNDVSGTVSFVSEGAPQAAVKAFMRVRQGDRFTLGNGSTLRSVYIPGGRQETWRGPSAFSIGSDAGKMESGLAPVVSMVPAIAAPKLARIPELVRGASLGGIRVRGGARPAGSNGPVPAQVVEAKAAYREWRKVAAADDLAPELYLLSVYQESGYLQDMIELADEMDRRQPGNAEVHELAEWARRRGGG